MWYLQADVLFRMLVSCGLMIVISWFTRKKFKKDFGRNFLLLFDLFILCSVSWQLAAAAAGYTIITYILARILKPLKKTKRFWFVIFCLLCTVPFFYGRLTEIFPNIPSFIIFIGIAYHMLKAVDAMYFVYYTDMKIPLLTYANYMLFFPTFTSGPIFRYRDFMNVFKNPVPLTGTLFKTSVKRLIKGMFKKMVVLYFVTTLFSHILSLELHWYTSVALIVLSYITVFLDLSGYSDMAIAVGSVMGYTVPENFRKPWAAASFTQFWRNWHITLSNWIREHVTVVLNNRRLGRKASAAMGFSIMFIMAMWHGFSIPGVIGGIYNGLCMGLENLFGLTNADKRKMKKTVYVFRCILVNFAFAINTLGFTVTPEQFIEIMKGVVR